MNLSEIIDNWEIDCKIDKTELTVESTRVPELHHKYLKIYSFERAKLIALMNEYKKLRKLKLEYYNGTLDEETLKEKGWPPFKLKLLKADLEQYIESDEQIIDIQSKIEYKKEMISTLQEIIKSINSRQYLIKSAIDWMRFTNGQ
jgi:hypothetical protein